MRVGEAWRERRDEGAREERKRGREGIGVTPANRFDSSFGCSDSVLGEEGWMEGGREREGRWMDRGWMDGWRMERCRSIGG